MRVSNICILTSLVAATQAWNINSFLQPLQNVLSADNNRNINNIKIDEFNTQINSFQSSKEFLAQDISGDAKYYTQFQDELSISLQQYNDQYILRLSDWTDGDVQDAFYQNVLEIAKEFDLNIWEKSVSHKFIDVQVTQDQGINLLSILANIYANEDYKTNIIILDLPQTIFETFPISQDDLEISSSDEVSSASEIFFKSYRDLESIYAWYDLLVDTYPDVLQLEYLGRTYQGRPLKALRLSIHSETKKDSIKTFVVTGGIHAREWISTSTSCYILYQLLADFEAGNPAVVRYLENLDFLFLPVMNPDGYAFTWKTERLWRKNRQQTFNPRCDGIDIDHSFDFKFTSGSESPCSDDYAGESAFEALESYHWDNYLNETKHSHPIYAYVDLHSYAEEVLYPYAYSCDILPRDEENLLELAYGLSQSIRLNSGKYYEVIKACRDKGADLLPSMGAGSALDYMYHNKAYWAFVLKLRDSGTHGFLLPPKHIEPVGQEIYASIKYFASFILASD